MKIKLSLMFLSALSLAGTGALAQIAPGDPAGNKTIPEKDQSRPSDAPSGGQQGGGEKDGSNLSDKLDESGGVLKPKPGIDPEIVKPAPVPHPNSTPVIRPPGVPGGPPGPEPK